MKSPDVDPQYQQITRLEAAGILGRSPAKFDRLRKEDPRCPKGISTGEDRMAKVLFRLSDIYDYSELLIQEGLERTDKKNAAA